MCQAAWVLDWDLDLENINIAVCKQLAVRLVLLSWTTDLDLTNYVN